MKESNTQSFPRGGRAEKHHKKQQCSQSLSQYLQTQAFYSFEWGLKSIKLSLGGTFAKSCIEESNDILKGQDVFLYCFISLETLVDSEAKQVSLYNVLQVNVLQLQFVFFLTTLHCFSLFSIHVGPKTYLWIRTAYKNSITLTHFNYCHKSPWLGITRDLLNKNCKWDYVKLTELQRVNI